MARTFRPDLPHRGEDRRWLLGVQVSSRCTEVAAALVATEGHGLEAQIDLHAATSAPVPPEATALFQSAAQAPGFAPAGLLRLRAQLAEVQAAVIHELLARAGLASTRVVAVGVHDPGLWACDRSGYAGYLGLCDPARVAETTGLSVIDAFPARDLAQHGLGGPITAIGQWLLLKEPARAAALLDLGRTTRMTYLPPAGAAAALSRILAFEVGPGTALPDVLAERLSGGQHPFDPGGRLAVQGRRIPQLIDHWLRDPSLESPLPRWHAHGVRPERFVADALQLALAHGWSVRDLLCSATHFVAEAVHLALRRRLPEDADLCRILVVGGGQHNGLLLREIASGTQVPLVRLSELHWPERAFEPACVAVLAMLYLDQVPANLPAVTGAEVPRLLGRLTPGSPQNWQRLLAATAGTTPAVRPLRAAV